MEPSRQILVKQNNDSLRHLYDKYAGMLLGYIVDMVKDRKLAEQHLVNIYNNIPNHLDEINRDGVNAWCHLQRFAKSYLLGTLTTAPVAKDQACNKFLSLMTDEQQQIFCQIYYHGKTAASLSQELNKPEGAIRKALKEAFAIIRKAS